MVIVRITMNALLEKHREVLQTLLSIIEPMQKEKGCLNYDVLCDIKDNNAFSLIEEWESREDLDEHIRSDRFSVLLGTKSLLREPPKVQIHTVSSSEDMKTINSARKKGGN